jgi:chromosomal replication initiation ATPase DnaA
MKLEILTREDIIKIFEELFEAKAINSKLQIKDFILHQYKPIENIDSFVSNYCLYFSVSKFELLGKSRMKSITTHRFIIWIILRKNHFSLEKIAKYFNRDHSTVLNGVSKAAIYANNEKTFKSQLDKALEIY